MPAPSIIPRTRRTVLSPIFRLAAIMTARTIAAPAHAAPAIPRFSSRGAIPAVMPEDTPRTHSAAPSDAPELIPRTYGPARGFMNNVCMRRPLSETAAPAIMAVSALGSLMFHIIRLEFVSAGLPDRMSHTSPGAIPALPVSRSAANRIRSRMAAAMK